MDIVNRIGGRVQEIILDRGAFFSSIRAGNYSEVRKFLKDPRASIGGALVESKDDIGQRPIHLAAALKETDILKLVVDEHGADINAVTDDEEFKRTALHIACMLGNFQSAKYLLDFGANPLIADSRGRNPIFYAKDGETRRAILRAQTIYSNLESVQVSFEYMKSFVGDGNVSAAVTEHLGEEKDASRIVKTYQAWQKSIIPAGAVPNADPDIPTIKIPGLSAVLKVLRSMRNERTMEEGYFAYIPKADMKDILVAFIRIAFVDYNGETAMQIIDIFVQQRYRKRFFATWLVAHACDFALRGPKHISKVFAVVPDSNHAAIQFFLALDFFKEPQYKVPWRLRKQGQAVYQIHDSGYGLLPLAKKLEKYSNHDIQWSTAEEREAQNEKEKKANQMKDYKYWEMKLKKAGAPAPLPRLEMPSGNLKGLPLLPLAQQSQSLRFIADLSVRRSHRYICENDRVPADVAEGFRPQIERSRLACDWQLRPHSRQEKQSRILNCPSELRNAWLDELDEQARMALPPKWISHIDEQGTRVYFNTQTHERTPSRPGPLRSSSGAGIGVRVGDELARQRATIAPDRATLSGSPVGPPFRVPSSDSSTAGAPDGASTGHFGTRNGHAAADDGPGYDPLSLNDSRNTTDERMGATASAVPALQKRKSALRFVQSGE